MMTKKEIISLITYYQAEINQLEFRKKNMKHAVRRLQRMLNQLDEVDATQEKPAYAVKTQRPPVFPDSPWDDFDDDSDDDDDTDSSGGKV